MLDFPEFTYLSTASIANYPATQDAQFQSVDDFQGLLEQLDRDLNAGSTVQQLVSQRISSVSEDFIVRTFNSIPPPREIPEHKQAGLLSSTLGGLVRLMLGRTASARVRPPGEVAMDYVHPIDQASVQHLPFPARADKQEKVSADFYSELTGKQRHYWNHWAADMFSLVDEGKLTVEDFAGVVKTGYDYMRATY